MNNYQNTETLARIREGRANQLKYARPYVPEPFVPGYFSVSSRDLHHFDIFSERRPGYVHWYHEQNPDTLAQPLTDGVNERAFCIRGEPGKIYIRDERWDKEAPRPRPMREFPSVESAMACVVTTLLIQP